MLRSRFQTLRPSPDLELTFGFYKLKFLKDFYILHKLNLFSMLDFTNALYTCTYQMKNEAGGKL